MKNQVITTGRTSHSDELKLNAEGGSNFKEEKTVINLRNYFSFYYLHVLYFSTIGPIFYLLFFWVRWVRASLQNLLFIKLNPWCAFQNLYWSTCAIGFVFALVLNNTGHFYTTLDAAFLYSTLINTFIRSATIAGKYATYPESEISRIFGQQIEASTVRGEMMIDFWNRQDSQTVEAELATLEKTFELGAFPSAVKVGDESMPVDQVVAQIIKPFNESAKPTIVITILTFLFAGARTIAHGLLNLSVGIRFHGDTTEEAVLFYFIAVFQFMYFSVGPMFYLLMIKDVRRQVLMSGKAAEILKKKPINELGNRIISMSDEESLLAALKVVAKLNTYGYRFILRHKCLLSFIVLHSLFLVLALFPFYFEIFDYSPWRSSQVKLQFLMVCDLTILSLASIIGLNLVAALNNRKENVDYLLKQLNEGSRPLNLIKESAQDRFPVVGGSLQWPAAVALTTVLVAGVAGGLYVIIAGRFKLA